LTCNHAATNASAPVDLPLGAERVARRHAPVKLQFVLVDDDADILFGQGFGANGTLPDGVSLQVENVPVGLEKTQVSHFARIVPKDGETIDSALSRVKPFFEKLPHPSGDAFGFQRLGESNSETGQWEDIGYRTILLAGEPVLTEKDVQEARARHERQNEEDRWVVFLELTKEGAERFRVFTRDHAGRRFAIVADDVVMSAPKIQSEIGGGHAVISMHQSKSDEEEREARGLAEGLGGY